jgi:D-glycero-beta-D-manno-heptose 1-phosphate adenylyltransferase
MTPSLDDVCETVARWRAQGNPVVLANGAFDLLHVGHLRYLQGAKALGGRLVVAVNSDSSVRAAKGPLRPVIPEQERYELVAALACVDVAFVFSEPDVRSIIRRLRPEFHAKGTDYSPETVPERDEVASYGGQTVITGDAKRHSTSEIEARLRER